MNKLTTYGLIQRVLPRRGAYWFAKMKQKELIEETRTGVYVVAYDVTKPNDPILIDLVLIGEVPDLAKRTKYALLAAEKCIRLGQNFTHLLSAESADETEEKYAGAARSKPELLPELSIAFGASGLSALADEALSALLLKDCRLATSLYLRVLASKGNNDILTKLI